MVIRGIERFLKASERVSLGEERWSRRCPVRRLFPPTFLENRHFSFPPRLPLFLFFFFFFFFLDRRAERDRSIDGKFESEKDKRNALNRIQRKYKFDARNTHLFPRGV